MDIVRDATGCWGGGAGTMSCPAHPVEAKSAFSGAVSVTVTVTAAVTAAVTVPVPSVPAFWAAFGDPASPEQRGRA